MLESPPHCCLLPSPHSRSSYSTPTARAPRLPSEVTCKRTHFSRPWGQEHPDFRLSWIGWQEKKRKGSRRQAIPTLVSSSMECGSQEVGLPTRNLCSQSRVGSHQGGPEDWMQGWWNSTPQPLTGAVGARHSPTHILPSNFWMKLSKRSRKWLGPSLTSHYPQPLLPHQNKSNL